jgi:hypothetical protein
MIKSKFFLTIILVMSLAMFSSELVAQDQAFSYAYVSIEGKLFSKKLKVEVDLGDTPEQITEGAKYSEILTNKKSYAAVLNYMVENQFELVETLDYIYTYQGSGGTSGIVFIMRKRK